MKTERWQKIEEIFHTAIAKSPTQRVNYLNQICAQDLTLRQEIESLIAFSDEAQDIGFLKNAAITRQTPVWSVEALVGQIIDEKYRIEKQLGQGGMGAVYLATHLGTGRTVAVKIIAPQFMGYSEFVERFKREAEATGRLRHPNVVNVTDFGFSSVGSDKLAYLVMEYLNGNTLGELLKEKGQLPLDLVVDIVEQICLAVEEAHKIGIIHRDLKPENIWLEPNGRGSYNVKVLDFGLAKLKDVPNSFQNTHLPLLERLKLIEECPNETSLMSMLKAKSISSEDVTLRQYATNIDPSTLDTSAKVTHGNIDPKTIPVWLTRAGVVLGTPLYMSPEQCNGGALDNRSDVYSLGVMTYQMLTGDTPFTGDFHQLIDKHTNMAAPIIKEKRKNLPELVSNSIMMALAKNPLDRPKSMTAFATILKANSQGGIALLRQAISIYSNNFFSFLAISKFAYTPLILSMIFTISWLVLPTWKVVSIDAGNGILYSLPLIILGVYFTKIVNGFITTPTVINSIANYKQKLRLTDYLTLFQKQKSGLVRPIKNFLITQILVILFIVIVTFLHNYANNNSVSSSMFFLSLLLIMTAGLVGAFFIDKNYRDTIFYESVLVIEGLKGKLATLRSKSLLSQLKGVKEYSGIILTVILIDLFFLFTCLVWTLNKLFNSSLDSTEKFMASLLAIFGLSIIGSLGFIVAPLFSIFYSLLYIQARQSNGESFGEIFEQFQKSISK
ncbi:MAG: serine/threonine protein kinase [Acidobacteria bacterium]|nr:serine/threonine protein kinase [Acidobacteriota bacterium]